MTSSRPTRSDVSRLTLLLGVLSVPAIVAPGVIGRAASHATRAIEGNPWFGDTPIALLYLAVPVVAISACTLVLAPGLLLTAASRRGEGAAEWLFFAFGVSLGVVSVASALGESIAPGLLRGRAYAVFLAGLGAACAVIAWWRAPILSVGRAPRDRTRVEVIALVAWALVLYYVLAPKLLFEAFNGDGAHAFESARLLLRSPLPFWPEEAGVVAGFPGLTSMLYAFPTAWFLRLFGEVEFAARVPFLLYLPVVGAGIIALSRQGEREPATSPGLLLAILVSLTSYALAMAYSATYSPYSADIALPATQDTLLVIAMLGVVLASLRRAWGWLFWFTILTLTSLPSGLVLVAFWLVARWLVERPRPWGDLVRSGAVLVGAMMLLALVPRVLALLGAPTPGGEYGVAGLARYFAFLQLVDVARVRYAAIPAGLFPVLVLVAWRWQDPVARALTVVTGLYFLFFFVQAHIALHHFVPAMLLPMVVAARVVRRGSAPVAPWIVLAVVAVLLALPRRFTVHGTGREVGAAVLERIGGYATSQPAPFRASELLDRVLAYDWDPLVPLGTYGGSPLVWLHYASHDGAPAPHTNYILQRSGDPVPLGFRMVAVDGAGATLLLRSDEVLASHRALRPPSPAGSEWLQVKRSILFRTVPHRGWPPIIDVRAVLVAMGLDVDSWLRRAGIEEGDR